MYDAKPNLLRQWTKDQRMGKKYVREGRGVSTYPMNKNHFEYLPYTFSAASTFFTPTCASTSASITSARRGSILGTASSEMGEESSLRSRSDASDFESM